MLYDTQTSYGEHIGVSQARVSKMISAGKIPARALKIISGKRRIMRDKADEALKIPTNVVAMIK
jgi:hypothetical protein